MNLFDTIIPESCEKDKRETRKKTNKKAFLTVFCKLCTVVSGRRFVQGRVSEDIVNEPQESQSVTLPSA